MIGNQGLLAGQKDWSQGRQAGRHRPESQIKTPGFESGQQTIGGPHQHEPVQQHSHPYGDAQDAFGNQLGRGWCGDRAGPRVTGAGALVAPPLVKAPLSLDLDLNRF